MRRGAIYKTEDSDFYDWALTRRALVVPRRGNRHRNIVGFCLPKRGAAIEPRGALWVQIQEIEFYLVCHDLLD
jgi:hypothetical protein